MAVKEKDWGDNRITAIFQPVTLPFYTADQPPTSPILLGSPRTESSTVQMRPSLNQRERSYWP